MTEDEMVEITLSITLMAEEELKSHLMKVKESGKTGLKLNIQKTKIMASGPITLWQIKMLVKENELGTSLVDETLPNAGEMSLIPDLGRICMPGSN